MPTTTEVMRVEVEMKAREALQQFEKLDQQFRETAGNNQALYKQLHREHKKYVSDVEKENKKRATDEKWLSQQLAREEEKRKSVILKEAREERQFANQLTKEMQQRVKDERWLTKELKREQEQREREKQKAAKGLGLLTRATRGLGGAFAALGAGLAARELGQFGASSLKAAGDMNNLLRGLEFATGSASAASVRFKELNELAKFPSLDRSTLIQYDAQLQNMGLTADENTVIFQGLSKGISTFGGSMHDVSGALLQLSQAFDKGKIISQDFRPILERTRGTFLSTAKEVHGFTGGIEEMRAAHEASGKTLQEFLIPVFKRLAETMPGAEVQSFTNLTGNLGDATNNLQAAIGQKLLPIFKEWGSTLLDIIERTTTFIDGEKTATENTESLADALNNTATSLESKKTAIEGYLETLDATSDKYFLIEGALAGYQEDIDELVGSQESHRQQLREVGADIVSLTEKQKTQSRVSKSGAAEYRRTTLALNQKLAAQKKLQAELDILNGVVATVTATTKDATTATESDTTATETNAKAKKDAKVAWVDYNDAIKNATATIKVYEAEQKRLAAESDMWTLLAKGTEGYGDTLELLNPKVKSLKDEHQTLFESIDKDIKDANKTLWEYIGTYDRWVVSQRGGITDVSGTRQPQGGGDAAAAMRRLSQPVNIENNRRSYVTSPLGDRRGTQSADFLGIPEQKIREFETKSDITLGILDDFNAQTKITAAELENLNDNGFAKFSNALSDISATIDSLDLGNFGVDETTGKAVKTFGRLASAATSGNPLDIPIALIAEPFKIYNDMMNEHNANVKKIFADEQELRRKGIEEEQRELDAYTAQRENLYAARMDFLQHGESTFSDWTDTLESFAGNDLKRGREVFVSFTEAMDAFNSAANQARLKLEPTAGSVQYNLYQRGQAIRAGAPTAGQTAAAAARTAEANSRTTRDAEAEMYVELGKIHKEHTEKKKAIDARYAERTQQLYNNLVDAVRDIQDNLTEYIADQQEGLAERNAERLKAIERLNKESLDAQAEAHREYAATMENLYRDMVDQWDALEDGYKERYKDRQQEITDILKAATAERVEIEKAAIKATEDAWADYHAEIGRIATELVDAIDEINQDIIQITKDSVAEIAELERDAIVDRVELYNDHQDKIAAIEARRIEQFAAFQERLIEIQKQATERRAAADATLAEKQENINRGVVDRITAIHEGLADTIAGLNENSVDLEQARLDKIYELNKTAKEKLEDLEREKSRTLEDMDVKYQRKHLDLNRKHQQDLRKLAENEKLTEEEKEKKKIEITRKYLNARGDLFWDRIRDEKDLQTEIARDTQDIERETADETIGINEETAEKQSEIGEGKVEATATAAEDQGEIETGAGISFEDAQAVYVPALSAHEQALKDHTAALNTINAAEKEAKAGVDADAKTVTAEYFAALKTETAEYNKNLTAINTELKNNTKAVKDDTAARIQVLEDRKTELETGAGMTYQEALALYQEKLPANTVALNRLNETLTTIGTNRTGALGTLQSGTTSSIAGIHAADKIDRTDTTAAQQALEAFFGVDIQTAMDNYVPKLNLAAAASKTLADSLTSINTSLIAEKGAITSAGILDASTVSELVKTATMEAAASILQLETDFGTPSLKHSATTFRRLR